MSIAAMKNAEIRLARRPVGRLSTDDFVLEEAPVAAPQAGQVLVRTEWLSMDPYLFERMLSDAMGPVLMPGQCIPGRGLGVVVQGDMPAGTLVAGELGWRRYATLDASALMPLQAMPQVPDTWHLSVLGAPGITAWLVLTQVLRAESGMTLLVSGAAGTVGALAGQLARRMGVRTIGIAGSPERASWLRAHGYDQVLNRRQVDDWRQALRATAPEGVDLYFDNVGGRILEAAVDAMKPRGSIALCGHAAEYTEAAAVLPTAPILYKRLTVRGFLVRDHVAQFGQARQAILQALRDAPLFMGETVHEGLESAPQALCAVLRGEGLGKHLVRVASPG